MFALGGVSAPEFELFDKITIANTEKVEFETKNDETATANENVETQNKKKGRPKVKDKKAALTIQKFSNHIEFIITSQSTKSSHIDIYLLTAFTWNRFYINCRYRQFYFVDWLT